MSATVPKVLVVEDTPTAAELLRALLTARGHDVQIVASVAAARDFIAPGGLGAFMLDLELPDGSGIDLSQTLRCGGCDVPVIVVTANASINTAVDAMRAGAADFIVKPFAKARLEVTLANVLEKQALKAELKSVRAQIERDRFFGFVGRSPAMRAVYRTIEAVATSRASVFITGESGTGKELAADAVRRASPRAAQPFIALNCGAIPANLLESEIFGHVKGAFTGASGDRAGAAKLADGGTLFLDEIAEMPIDVQPKLLRFIQTGSFQPVGGSRIERADIRFISATNRDPLAEIASRRLREDLYYRLHVVPVELPPLRARGDDILLIGRHFRAMYCEEDGRNFRAFTPEAERALMAHNWPGNVRELQNIVQGAVVLNDGDVITRAMIPSIAREASSAVSVQARPPVPEVRVVPDRASDAFEPVAMPPLRQLSEPADAGADFGDLAAPGTRPDMPFSGTTASPGALTAGFEPQAIVPDSVVVSMPPTIIPLHELEKQHILAALAQTDNDVPRAAALLQINPSTIYRKLQAWNPRRAAAD